jgi:hypothetical protein
VAAREAFFHQLDQAAQLLVDLTEVKGGEFAGIGESLGAPWLCLLRIIGMNWPLNSAS